MEKLPSPSTLANLDHSVVAQWLDNHPEFLAAVEKTIKAANKAGKATGILFFNPEEYSKYHQMGIRFIACGADATFVAEGAKNMVEKLAKLRSQAS